MKFFFIISLLSVSLTAGANNINEKEACESMAMQGTIDYDRSIHEDNLVSGRVISSTFLRNGIEYRVRVGREIETAGAQNSEYRVFVRFLNNQTIGRGTTLACTIPLIEETRKR